MLFNMVGKSGGGSGGGGTLQYATKQFSKGGRFTNTAYHNFRCLLTFPDNGDYFVICSYVTQNSTSDPVVSNPQNLTNYVTTGDITLTPLLEATYGYYQAKFLAHVNAANSTLRIDTTPSFSGQPKIIAMDVTIICVSSSTNNVTAELTDLSA